MNPIMIIWPMVILALVTLAIYFPMSRARVASVKSGKVKGSVYKLNEGEPEESKLFNGAIRNQYESPVLFYAVCVAAYATGNAGVLMIVLAWIFAIVKSIHVYVHISSNNLRVRRPVFMVAYFTLIALWIVFALQMSGIL